MYECVQDLVQDLYYDLWSFPIVYRAMQSIWNNSFRQLQFMPRYLTNFFHLPLTFLHNLIDVIQWHTINSVVKFISK